MSKGGTGNTGGGCFLFFGKNLDRSLGRCFLFFASFYPWVWSVLTFGCLSYTIYAQDSHNINYLKTQALRAMYLCNLNDIIRLIGFGRTLLIGCVYNPIFKCSRTG